MPVSAFTNTEYSEVRAAADLRLTEDTLPNAVIALDIFEGEARRYVNSLVPDAIITANPDRAKSAAVLWTAALIMPSLPQVVKEDIPGGSMQFSDRNLMAAAELRKSEAMAIIGGLQALNTATVTVAVPTVFTAADAPCGR